MGQKVEPQIQQIELKNYFTLSDIYKSKREQISTKDKKLSTHKKNHYDTKREKRYKRV